MAEQFQIIAREVWGLGTEAFRSVAGAPDGSIPAGGWWCTA